MKGEVAIVGAGVVGCATAYELARAGHAVTVLEAGPRIAEGVTSRNSGVIHAGLYYPPGSLKAESCVRGQALLYEWCAARGVPQRRTGKWVVAQADEEAELVALHDNARASGATGVSLRSGAEVRAELPWLVVARALLSEGSGIVDPYEYARSFRLAAEELGATFVMEAPVTGIAARAVGGYALATARGPLEADAVVNAAGLQADAVARMVGIGKYWVHPWRGDYFRLAWRRRCDRLIYPVKRKDAPGLGVHLTIGLDGTYRLGPDVALVAARDDFAPPSGEALAAKREAFWQAARRYLGDLTLEDIQYDGCGIRPKLRGPGDARDPDFVLSEDLPGFVNLVGIESPGLTAARDLAQRVAALL